MKECVYRSEYEKIERGMSYEQAALVFGAPGRQTSCGRVGGVLIQSYEWCNPNGSHASITLVNGRVVSKEQIGLE